MSNQDDFLAELKKEFLDEALHFLAECEASYLKLGNPDHRHEELSKIFRMAHSLKGAGASLGFKDLSEFAHKVEDFLAVLRTYPEFVNEEVIQILLKCGDSLKERVQELSDNVAESKWNPSALAAIIKQTLDSWQNGGAPVVNKEPTPQESSATSSAAVTAPTAPAPEALNADNPGPSTAEKIPAPAASNAGASTHEHEEKKSSGQAGKASIKVDAERVEGMLNIVGELVVIKSQLMNQCMEHASDLRLSAIASQMDKTIRELQDRTLAMRMTPLKTLFMKVHRVVHDLSAQLGKKVEFTMSGEDTEIDRTMVEALSDPLIHMARNCVDHGIEKSEVRVANGKDPIGKIHLSSSNHGGRVVVEISDDGAGINRDKVRSKAISSGLIQANQDLSDSQIFGLLFEPGFSTAEKVTDVSGRGVGMDVVKTNIERLKGKIEIQSTQGKGSTFSLSLPLTTSITDGMLLKEGSENFVFPMDGVRELVNQGDLEFLKLEHGQIAAKHRQRIYPILELGNFLGMAAARSSRSGPRMYLQIESGRKHFLLGVEAVLGQTQVVLKALGGGIGEIRGISGGAILGDGKIALVLDPHGLRDHLHDAGFKGDSSAGSVA